MNVETLCAHSNVDLKSVKYNNTTNRTTCLYHCKDCGHTCTTVASHITSKKKIYGDVKIRQAYYNTNPPRKNDY